MGQIKLTGSIIGGPPNVTEGTFPASTIDIPLGTKESPKAYQRATGILQRSIAEVAWKALAEPGDTVTKANFLYFRTDSPLQLRLTTDDGAGGDVTATMTVQGLVVLEFNTDNYLKQIEVLGTAQVEYFTSGNE